MRTSLLDQPIGRLLQRRMIGGQTGFRQRDDVDGRVPDRRETRLNAKILRIVDKEPGEILRRLYVNRVRFRITERAQRDRAN